MDNYQIWDSESYKTQEKVTLKPPCQLYQNGTVEHLNAETTLVGDPLSTFYTLILFYPKTHAITEGNVLAFSSKSLLDMLFEVSNRIMKISST